MILSPEGVFLLLPYRVVCHVYHVHGFYFRGKLLLTLDIWLVTLFIIAIARRPPLLVFGVELVGLLEDPTISVGMISWFIGVAMNLVGPVQYLAQIGWSISIFLEWLLPLTGFGAAESGVDRCVVRSRITIATFVLIAWWFPIAVSNFRSARVAGTVASTTEPAVFSRAKAGHESGKG